MKEKLRLAVFGHKRWSREGGVEIVVKELCTRMARDGCDVTCYNRAGHHVSGAEYDDIQSLEIRDCGAPAANDVGKIQKIDDYGQFHTLWKAGKNFTVLPGIDSFVIIHNNFG